nr:hypothetical protein PB20LOC_04352 [Pectobacterium parmentieri]
MINKKAGSDPNDPSGFLLSAVYRLISVSIISLPRSTVTVIGIPVINPDSSSQRPLRLMADGGLGLPFYSSHFETRPAGQLKLFKPVYHRFVRGVSHRVVTLCFGGFINGDA